MSTVFIADKFQCAPQDMRKIEVDPNLTLEQVSSTYKLSGYVANKGGGINDFVFDKDWSRTLVDDDVLIFSVVPEDGDSDILGFVLAIAVSAVAPWAAGIIFGSSSGLALAVTTLGLNMAASALLPAPEPPRAQKVPEPSTQYSARVQTNSARLGEPVPWQCGRISNRLPDMTEPEFYEYVDGDQYVSMRYCLGLHDFQVHSLKFKNINIDDIPDAQYEIVPPNQTGALLPANTFPSLSVPSGNMTTDWSLPAITCPVGEICDNIGIDIGFLGGLVSIADNGSLNNTSVTVEYEYRLITDTGTPIGGWVSLITNPITAATVDAVRKTLYANAPAGRHEVRGRVTAEPSTNTKIRNKVTWSGLRGQNNNHIVYSDRTMINVRLRISEGSNQKIGNTLQNFTVDCTALSKTWDGTSWSNDLPNSSIMWAFAKAYSDAGLGGRDVGRLWLDDMKALEDKLEVLNHHFDYVFDQKISLQESLAFIARYGRCVAIPYSGTYVLIRDEPQEAITHIFHPDNCRNFHLEIENALPVDHTILTYSDPVSGQPKELVHEDDGSQRERPNRVSFLGCRSRRHAMNEIRHFHLSNKISVTGGLEYNNLKKPIGYSSRCLVPQVSRYARQFGQIKKRTGNVLMLTEPHGIDGAASLAIDDNYHDPVILNVLNIVDEYTVEVEPIPAGLEIVDTYQTKNATSYLLQDVKVSRRIMRVRSIEGESKGWIKISLTSEGVEEPVIDPVEDTLNDSELVAENLTIRNMSVIQEADASKFILRCAVDALPDADRYVAQINDGGGVWRTVYEGFEPQFSFVHKPATIQLRVAAGSSTQGAWLVKTVNIGHIDEVVPVVAPSDVVGYFDTGDLVMDVSQVSGASKYRWTIFDTGTMTLRHTVDTGYRFAYTVSQAKADGGAWRDITVRVHSIDVAGNVSDAYAELVKSNPQIGEVANVTAAGFLDTIMVRYDWPTDADADAILIYASETQGFTPSAANLQIESRNSSASFAAPIDTTWYIRVAAHDRLGKDELTFTPEHTAITNKLAPSELEINEVRDAVLIADAIKEIHIADNAIKGVHIDDDEISDAHIAADAIKETHITDNAIKTEHITVNSIVSAKIATGAIIAGKIATNAITAIKISANAITAGKISANAIESNKIKAGAVVADKIATNAVTAVKITAGAIVAAKIATGAITAVKISANAITATKIAVNAVTAAKISVSTLSAITANLGTITAAIIKNVNNRFVIKTSPAVGDFYVMIKAVNGDVKFSIRQDGLVTVGGGAKISGELHAEKFTSESAVIDTLHIKNGAVSDNWSVTGGPSRTATSNSGTSLTLSYGSKQTISTLTATLHGHESIISASFNCRMEGGFSHGNIIVELFIGGVKKGGTHKLFPGTSTWGFEVSWAHFGGLTGVQTIQIKVSNNGAEYIPAGTATSAQFAPRDAYFSVGATLLIGNKV